MSAPPEAIVTARLRPELFAERGLFSASRTLVFTALAVLVLAGFGFRVNGLSAEGLSEDELKKLNAVADYRQHGLTAANGEHPMLMKALQTGSIFIAEKWNNTSFVTSGDSALHVPAETALRLPGTIFGALTAILIYLLAAELFGPEVALIAAALWAFDPQAIGFSRIAKEDTFLLFFFLLANVFWLRGQRVAESQPDRRPEKYYWATAAAFGAMMASKYLPQLLTISISYYWLFQRIPETRWRLGKRRMLIFFGIMGVAFVLFNPTILLPSTWLTMKAFASSQTRVGYEAIASYEYLGQLYPSKITLWLNGVPWHFYYVFMMIKLPLLTIGGFLAGLPLLFRRKLGDGRYLIMLWLFLWMMTFSFAGGKFTRYFASVLPAVLITSAIGVQFVGRLIAQQISALFSAEEVKSYVRAAIAALVVLTSVEASVNAAPDFRLYTNALGGGMTKAGDYFPHDEFFDGRLRESVSYIAAHAENGVQVASETPNLTDYYARRAGRVDLISVWLSDEAELQKLRAGDYVIVARGRRYLSNDAVLSQLQASSSPVSTIVLGWVPAVQIFKLDDASLAAISHVTKAR